MTKIQRKIATIQGQSYPYWIKGNKDNPPMLLISGFTGTHDNLLLLAQKLEDRFFLLIPEFPGWGQSQIGDSSLTITSYAHFLKNLLDAISLDKSWYVAGHCMGAVVALDLAYLYPQSVKELFLISTPYGKGKLSQDLFIHLTHIQKRVPVFIRPLLYFWRSRLFAIPLGFLVIQSRSWRKKVTIILENARKQSLQNETVVEKNWASLVNFNYEKVKELTLPIHILHGEKDMLVQKEQAQELSQLFKNATFDYIPFSGHTPPIETPERLAKLIEKYVLDNAGK